MSKKETSLALTEEELSILSESYPVIENEGRQTFPRMGVLADDLVEETGTGKNKKIIVLQPAGTFFTSKDLGETDETGKKIWTAEYLDETIDVVITFHRYQLKIYDKGLKKYISSQIYDQPNQYLSLYLDKQVIKKGVEKDLQALYPERTTKGKMTTGLKKQIILYVVYNEEMYQFDTNQTSQWSFRDYQKTVEVPKVVTTMGSTGEMAGTTKFRKLNFKNLRPISRTEFNLVKDGQEMLKNQVEQDSRFLLSAPEEKSVEEEYDKL